MTRHICSKNKMRKVEEWSDVYQLLDVVCSLEDGCWGMLLKSVLILPLGMARVWGCGAFCDPLH